MARIQFDRLVISPQYGNCDTGDIVQCSEAFARHCVHDLGAAHYLDTPQPTNKRQPRRRGGKRATHTDAG